jgi:hypothetical protein
MFEDELLQPIENVGGQRSVPLYAGPHRVSVARMSTNWFAVSFQNSAPRG